MTEVNHGWMTCAAFKVRLPVNSEAPPQCCFAQFAFSLSQRRLRGVSNMRVESKEAKGSSKIRIVLLIANGSPHMEAAILKNLFFR